MTLDSITQHNAEILYKGHYKYIKLEDDGKLKVLKWHNLIDRFIAWIKDPKREIVQNTIVDTTKKILDTMRANGANPKDKVFQDVTYADFARQIKNSTVVWRETATILDGSTKKMHLRERIEELRNASGMQRTDDQVYILFNQILHDSKKVKEMNQDFMGEDTSEIDQKFLTMSKKEFNQWLVDSPEGRKWLEKAGID